MKKMILISALILGGLFIGSSSMPTEMSAPRCKAWAIRCPNCGWSTAWPGCTWGDPYPLNMKCSRCNWIPMYHIGQPCDGLCE